MQVVLYGILFRDVMRQRNMKENEAFEGLLIGLVFRPKLTLSTCSLSGLMLVLKFLSPDQLCISIQHLLSTSPFFSAM
jgi:hypothetical protein